MEYYFKFYPIEMSALDYSENIQFGSGGEQSSSNVNKSKSKSKSSTNDLTPISTIDVLMNKIKHQSKQTSSTDIIESKQLETYRNKVFEAISKTDAETAVYMLMTENKPQREEIPIETFSSYIQKPQSNEVGVSKKEEGSESIRRFIHVQELIEEDRRRERKGAEGNKKQQLLEMITAMRDAEEKYFGPSDEKLHLSKDEIVDTDSDLVLELDQSETSKIKKIRCYCNQELTGKNYLRHLQTDKHLKNERRSYRNKVID